MHCHNEWDLPTALGIAEAVAPAKPLWIEDAMPVLYSDSWRQFKMKSPVRVMTGEKLEHPAEFLQFMSNGAIDVIHPDLAFVGGITGGRKIADLAELFYIPVVTHNVGSFVQLAATAHYRRVGAQLRDDREPHPARAVVRGAGRRADGGQGRQTESANAPGWASLSGRR